MEPKKRLGSDQRIRRQTTFKNLVEKGQFARGEFFYLWVSQRDDQRPAALKEKPKVGIVVNRKVEPTAVGRNFWKRRVREIFREHQAQLRRGATCLVKVHHTRGKPSFAAADKDLVTLFKKAGAWA